MGILSAWLIIEIALRIVAPTMAANIQAPLRQVYLNPWSSDYILPPPLIRADNYFGYVNTPNVVNTRVVANSGVTFYATTINWLDPNSHVGFRVDSPNWQPRWPVDAVIVGDSFSFCFSSYEECWTQQLASVSAMSTVNLAISATGSTSHLRVLQTFGLSYEPRVVIWQWFGNDFNDDYWLDVTSGVVTAETFDPPNISCEPDDPFLSWVRHNSAAYATLGVFACAPPSASDHVDPYRVNIGDAVLHFGQKSVSNDFDMNNFRNLYGWDTTQDALLAARDLMEDHKAELVVILIPTKEEVYRSLTAPILGAEQISNLSEGRQKMLSFCQEHELKCLDLMPALQASAEDNLLVYWPTDFHLNPEGNRVIAEAIYTFLQQQGLAK